MNIFLLQIKNADKPVIVLAANAQYYEPLQAAVYQIHKHLSDYKIIIYDLGMNTDMIEKVLFLSI